MYLQIPPPPFLWVELKLGKVHPNPEAALTCCVALIKIKMHGSFEFEQLNQD